MKRMLALALIAVTIVNLSGCDALQRKFTRKKKVVKKPRIHQLKKYDIKPSLELYEKHFAYWQSWSSELMQRLGDNHKKDSRCIEELLGQIHDMRNILIDEKAEALQKHITTYERVRTTILREDLTQFNKDSTRMTLERQDRIIKRDFNADRVRNFIKKEFDEVSQEEAQAPAISASAGQATQAIMQPAQELVPADRVVPATAADSASAQPAPQGDTQ